MRQAFRLLKFVALTAVLLVVTASLCKKETPPERQWERGAFQSLPANTKPYQLPAGISIVTMYGADDPTSMSDLPLLMTVHNSGQDDMEVTFPAGLVFGPSPAEYQYMILLQDCSFTAPGGADRDVLLPTYCCNADSTEPDDASFYFIAGREWDRETQELLDLVVNKALSGEDAVPLAQDALFEITDGDSLLVEAVVRDEAGNPLPATGATWTTDSALTTTVRSSKPVRTVSSSPTFGSFEGLQRSPRQCTLPPSMASLASARVL